MHYARLTEDYVGQIVSPDAMVLDYGCSDALGAPDVARACKRLYLFDAAANSEAALRRRFANDEKITVLTPEDLDALSPASLDLVICNSVLQYLSLEECQRFFELSGAKLKRGGRLIVADVIPPNAGIIGDTLALLAFAWRGAFMIAALRGLVATYFSDYRKLRSTFKLTTFTERDILDRLAAAGFRAERNKSNFTHNAARMTFIATRI